ncbi:TRAP transporter large permease [Candidatus Latescibacterota bacterium]
MISALAVVLALLGTPLFVIIAGLALASFLASGIDLTVVFIEMYRLADTPALTAIPLFAFGGFALAESGAARRLVRISEAVLGWLPGGLAIMALAICALLTAFTGASGMTIVAVGGLLYPALKQSQYPEGFSLGLLTTSGSLGLLFPPSIPLILYGIVSGTPVDRLFLAGIIPGFLLIGALSAYCFAVGRRTARPTARLGPREAARAVREGFWELLLPVVVIAGIYGGVIAVSEAAALSVLYILLVEMLIHRELRPRQLPGILRETMVLVGGIFVILAAAMAYTNYMVDAEVPARLLSYIEGHITSRFAFLILLNLFLLAVGCMIDMFSALIVVVPLILPIASAYDVHPIHLGIIFLTNLEIGYSTPPVGLNLFIASARFERPVLQLYRASLPFLGILLAALLIITYVPQLSLVLVRP